jgi:hypothetical protein
MNVAKKDADTSSSGMSRRNLLKLAGLSVIPKSLLPEALPAAAPQAALPAVPFEVVQKIYIHLDRLYLAIWQTLDMDKDDSERVFSIPRDTPLEPAVDQALKEFIGPRMENLRSLVFEKTELQKATADTPGNAEIVTRWMQALKVGVEMEKAFYIDEIKRLARLQPVPLPDTAIDSYCQTLNLVWITNTCTDLYNAAKQKGLITEEMEKQYQARRDIQFKRLDAVAQSIAQLPGKQLDAAIKANPYWSKSREFYEFYDNDQLLQATLKEAFEQRCNAIGGEIMARGPDYTPENEAWAREHLGALMQKNYSEAFEAAFGDMTPPRTLRAEELPKLDPKLFWRTAAQPKASALPNRFLGQAASALLHTTAEAEPAAAIPPVTDDIALPLPAAPQLPQLEAPAAEIGLHTGRILAERMPVETTEHSELQPARNMQ